MLAEFGVYLRSRRERLRPEDLGLPAGPRRRTPGLRREELAEEAAISVDYLIRLEQGRLRPSESVLDGLARALRLAAPERERLFALARPPLAAPAPPPAAPRPALQRLVAALDPLPAYLLDGRLDVIACNDAAEALFGAFGGRNIARLVFTDPDYRARLATPAEVEAEAAGALRLALTRDPRDAALRALVEELLGASEAFRALWEAQEVREKSHGRKAFLDGDGERLELEWERLEVPGAGGLALMAYSAAGRGDERRDPRAGDARVSSATGSARQGSRTATAP